MDALCSIPRITSAVASARAAACLPVACGPAVRLSLCGLTFFGAWLCLSRTGCLIVGLCAWPRMVSEFAGLRPVPWMGVSCLGSHAWGAQIKAFPFVSFGSSFSASLPLLLLPGLSHFQCARCVGFNYAVRFPVQIKRGLNGGAFCGAW